MHGFSFLRDDGFYGCGCRGCGSITPFASMKGPNVWEQGEKWGRKKVIMWMRGCWVWVSLGLDGVSMVQWRKHGGKVEVSWLGGYVWFVREVLVGGDYEGWATYGGSYFIWQCIYWIWSWENVYMVRDTWTKPIIMYVNVTGYVADKAKRNVDRKW